MVHWYTEPRSVRSVPTRWSTTNSSVSMLSPRKDGLATCATPSL